MRHDDIGREALCFHGQGCPETSLASNGFGFEIGNPRMNIGRGTACRFVVDQFHALPIFGFCFLHGHGQHAMALLDQCGC